MAAMEITSADGLTRLPDGTIIRWLRIPGDETSEAVAFVRQDIDDQAPPTAHGGPAMVTWISPGGWDPMTIEAAGVTYPAEVLRWGNRTIVPEWPPLIRSTLLEAQEKSRAWSPEQQLEALSGGTWAREKALECATRVYAGNARHLYEGTMGQYVIDLANIFEAWLDPEPEATAPTARLSDRLRAAADAIDEARQSLVQTESVTLSVDAIRRYAYQLDRLAESSE